jgi:hypothetical protein
MVLLAAMAFVAIFLFEVPFPFIVVVAAGVGLIGGRVRPAYFCVIQGQEFEGPDEVVLDNLAVRIKPSWKRTMLVAVAWLLLWFVAIAVAPGAARSASCSHDREFVLQQDGGARLWRRLCGPCLHGPAGSGGLRLVATRLEVQVLSEEPHDLGWKSHAPAVHEPLLSHEGGGFYILPLVRVSSKNPRRKVV